MILAAGRGDRMRPLTDSVPKPLLKAGGKPLIVWHLERLASAGITDIVINHAWLGQQIEAALGDGSRYGVKLRYSREAEALDTAGGIANALPLLGNEPFLLVSGDLYADYDAPRLCAVADTMRGDLRVAHLLLGETQPLPPYHFSLDQYSGLLLHGPAPQLTYAGIGVFRPSLFAHILAGAKAALLPLLQGGVAERAISGEIFTGPLDNLTTPADLESLNRRLGG